MPSTNCGFLYIGTWVVLIVGWIVVDKLNNQRETRKELRTRIDQIYNWITDTVENAIAYHTSTRDLSLERKLKSQIARTTNAISSLYALNSSLIPYRAFRFRNSITLFNFDTPTHESLCMDHETIGNIAGCSQDLIDALEIAYSEIYHRSLLEKIKNR